MPEYLSPGVYMEEIELGPKAIEGASTSTAGFLGETERGPVAPRLVTGFAQFQRIYGGHSWLTGGVTEGDRAAAQNARAAADKAVKDKAAAEKAATTKAAADNSPANTAAAEKAKAEREAAEQVAAEAARREKALSATKSPTPSSSYLAYAVEGFFANGGKRCYVGRIVGSASAAAELVLKDCLRVTAVGPGTWGNRIAVSIHKASSARPGDKLEESLKQSFRLEIKYWESQGSVGTSKGLHSEVYDGLSWDPNSADYFERQIHDRSQFVVVQREASGTAIPTVESTDQFLGGGADAEPTLEDYKGGVDNGDDHPASGLAGLAEKDDISIVCVPDASELDGLSDAVVAHCEQLRDRIAVLHADRGAKDVGELVPESRGTAINSKYAAFYYPWVKVIDPVTNLPKLVPPSGHVAGIYARTDTERGVHKAPANEPVRGVIDLQFNINKGDQDVLNPRGVNCIRSFPGRGILLWGARTTSSDPLWKYVNVRRLFLFLEKSIERSTQWVVFEPNNERLWARVRQSVSDFLAQVWKDGALIGATPEQAFFVRCDETTMTPNEIETGRLIVVVGLAPARPAEFVIFRLAQARGGSSITE